MSAEYLDEGGRQKRSDYNQALIGFEFADPILDFRKGFDAALDQIADIEPFESIEWWHHTTPGRSGLNVPRSSSGSLRLERSVVSIW